MIFFYCFGSELQDEARRGPLLPCIYSGNYIFNILFITFVNREFVSDEKGLKDLHEHIVMRTRSLPENDNYQSLSPIRRSSEHSSFYTPRLGRAFYGKFYFLEFMFIKVYVYILLVSVQKSKIRASN